MLAPPFPWGAFTRVDYWYGITKAIHTQILNRVGGALHSPADALLWIAQPITAVEVAILFLFPLVIKA
jgi:hypothetical protein